MTSFGMNKNQNVNSEDDENLQRDIYTTLTNIIDGIVTNSTPSNSSSIENKNGRNRLDNMAIVHCSQPEIRSTFEIYRATELFSESHSDVDVGVYVTSLKQRNAPSIPMVPPSYSTVIRQGRPSLDIRRDVRSTIEIQPVGPIARVPPPSYAEIQGVWSREISNSSSEQILLGPDPIYIWCTRCSTVVVTVIQPQRSKFTHFTAAALCLFGCWPCAMLPYCMNSCKNIYHYCPDCNYLFGMYRPW